MIFHEPTREYVYPIERNQLAVRIRVSREWARSCTIHYWNWARKNQDGAFKDDLRCYARDGRYDYYEAIIITQGPSRYLQYYFRIVSQEGDIYWLNYHGIQDKTPKDGLFLYAYTNENDIFRVPDWARGASAYQIFPERFYNGDPSNDPNGTEEWSSVPTRENFMGGDLQGILDRVCYLKDLGIDMVYLNPIFKAKSNHKYDTIDYMAIDPAFGDMDTFRQLVNELHRHGIRVLLDGVFNHCGHLFLPFKDVLKRGESSPYKDWFFIEDYPVVMDRLDYECFAEYPQMPKLRLSNSDARDYILKVGKYWIEAADIDGWRLDVADDIDYTFLQLLRKELKSIKPDCFLLGETWVEKRDMLRGDQMDSVMNYVFRDAVVDFFAKNSIDSRFFDERLNHFIGNYSKTALHVLYNPLDSHDTERFLTLCGGNKNAMKAAAAFQFCFPGIPAVYYGDEVGMAGGNDPDCRGAMKWEQEKQDTELLSWYRQFVSYRHNYPALRYGRFGCNYATGQIYGFFREYEGERVYIVINNGNMPTDIVLPVLENYGDKVQDFKTNDVYTVLKNSDGYNADIYSYFGEIKLHLLPWQVCLLIKLTRE